tara:strand:- start:1834 stop:2478 length:645 start_codon:yes stop_codon:yes gene_type:complete
MSVWTIVVAAGDSVRFGSDKQMADLFGKPVLVHALFTASQVSDGLVVVTAPDRCLAVEELVSETGITAKVVVGASTRSSSVRAGLAALPDDTEVVLIHDGARPLASVNLFNRVLESVQTGNDAVVPCVAISDSLRLIGGEALDRDEVVVVQTPQGFDAQTLYKAHQSNDEASDDATLIERLGRKVSVVEGEKSNIKITVPIDLKVAELYFVTGD